MKTVAKADLDSYVGKSLGASEWFAIDQDRINAFADTTLDHQFIHVDPEKAKHTPFGTTIAHGFLTLSLLPYFQTSMADMIVPEGLKMGMNYGFDKIRFLAPVKVGGLANPAAASLTMDIFIAAVTGLVWMTFEAKRLGMKHLWFYYLTTCMVAFAFAFPFFLFQRERFLQRMKNAKTA